MARQWVRAGHEITIIAASWSHLRQAQPDLAGPHKLELIDGIT
jgi:hypothetical protein